MACSLFDVDFPLLFNTDELAIGLLAVELLTLDVLGRVEATLTIVPCPCWLSLVVMVRAAVVPADVLL